MRGVLQLVAEKSGWGKRNPAKGHGAGVAFHYSFQGYFAHVAEVSVTANKVLRCNKIWVCGDVGSQIVNPSGAEAQVQGASWMAKRTDESGDHAEAGRVVQTNYNQHTLLRLRQAPGLKWIS